MTQQIDLFDAIGKTITGIKIGNAGETCIIKFEDDTFTTIDATGGGESCYFELSTNEHFDPLQFGDYRLADLGIYSLKELAAIRKERTAKHKADQEKRERIQLERLQKKYGTT